MKKCFIVCPIGADGSDIRKRSDTLFKHVISPVCTECNFDPIRIDKENTNGSLTDEIISHICNDDLVIADITDSNPNAFYEIGYRAAISKPSIHLMSKDSSIPFDVSYIRTFEYDLSDLDSVDQIKERLIKTIKSIDFDSNATITPPDTVNPNTLNSQLLQEIYKIQDGISALATAIESKDSGVVSVLADKIAGSNAKSPDATLMEILIPKLLENPNALDKFAEISEKFSSK